MKKSILFILLILTLTSYSNKTDASPPMYVNDPKCFVSGVIKNIQLKTTECDLHCQQCKDPKSNITDCEWLPASEVYLANILISTSSNSESAKDNVICNTLYIPNTKNIFLISTNLVKQIQLNNGDIVSGNVLRGGEFSSIVKDELHLSILQKINNLLLGNLIWLTALGILLIIILIIIFVVVNKSKNSSKNIPNKAIK